MLKISFSVFLFYTFLSASPSIQNAFTDQNIEIKTVALDFSIPSIIKRSPLISKIVISILFGCSIIVWMIIIVKGIYFFSIFKKIKKEKQWVEKISDLNQPYPFEKSFINILYVAINQELKNTSICKNIILKGTSKRIKHRLDFHCLYISSLTKKGIPPLASIASVAPFIGLFGTIWGIMNSFIGIANAKNISLNVVAPGIAEALFATALGLTAAIPAVIAYNFFIRLNTKFYEKLCFISSTLFLISDKQIAIKKNTNE